MLGVVGTFLLLVVACATPVALAVAQNNELLAVFERALWSTRCRSVRKSSRASRRLGSSGNSNHCDVQVVQVLSTGGSAEEVSIALRTIGDRRSSRAAASTPSIRTGTSVRGQSGWQGPL